MTQGLQRATPTVAQVFTPSLDCAHKATVAISGTSARVALPARTDASLCGVVGLYTTTACFIRFTTVSGDAVVTDIPLAASTLTFFGVPGGATHVAAITSGGTGDIYVHGIA